jgi:hypothetical protein
VVVGITGYRMHRRSVRRLPNASRSVLGAECPAKRFCKQWASQFVADTDRTHSLKDHSVLGLQECGGELLAYPSAEAPVGPSALVDEQVP